MNKIVCLFPGQGSQYVGMAHNLKEHKKANDVLNLAKESLDFDITQIMFNGPEDTLKLTAFTQPAIVTHSIALFTKLKEFLNEKSIDIDCVLGHSVGEYSALVAAGAIEFQDAIKAVNKRGTYMQEATPEGLGAMYAILRVPIEYIEKACLVSSNESEKVMPANYNDPTQVVISGHLSACERAVNWLKENYEGKQMAIPLKVSAPFHSELMLPAQEKLDNFLNTIQISENKIDYIANIDAKKYSKNTDPKILKKNLVEQVSGSVKWLQSLENFEENTLFIEVGPGKVLTGLNKKINKNFKTLTLDSEESFVELAELISGN